MSGGWDENSDIGSWIDKDRWDARARPRIVLPGTRVVLGFNGSHVDDWTGIRLETFDGFQFTPAYGPDKRPTIWNPADFDGQVPRLKVDAAMDEVMRTYNVVRAYMDPPCWETEVDTWADRFGDQRVIRWYTQRTIQTHAAAERLVTDVTKKDSTFTHDGCETTSAHVSNARKAARPGSRYVLRKASIHQKIDLGMCSLLAHEAAGDAIAASARRIQSMSAHRVELGSNGTRHTLIIDGVDLSAGLQGAKLELAVGELPRLTIDPVIFELDASELGHARVIVSDQAAKALAALGWTPPRSEVTT